MRNLAVGAAVLALATGRLMPLSAQAGAGMPALTPEEAEAHQMSLEMAFACSPRRHNQAAGSESVIEREPAPMVGTAVFFRGIEGTFLALEEYNEDLDGHCLVLGWFGGPLEPRRYEIRQLAMRTVEAQVGDGNHTFFSMSAVRESQAMSIFVTESGTLDIASVEPGRITGSFDLTGFLIEGANRADGVVWKGSFTAMEGDG